MEVLVGEEEGVVLADADATGAGGTVGEEDELLQQLHSEALLLEGLLLNDAGHLLDCPGGSGGGDAAQGEEGGVFLEGVDRVEGGEFVPVEAELGCRLPVHL